MLISMRPPWSLRISRVQGRSAEGEERRSGERVPRISSGLMPSQTDTADMSDSRCCCGRREMVIKSRQRRQISVPTSITVATLLLISPLEQCLPQLPTTTSHPWTAQRSTSTTAPRATTNRFPWPRRPTSSTAMSQTTCPGSRGWLPSPRCPTLSW